MCDEPCTPIKPIPFVKKQAATNELCGKTCSGQNLEINCITSKKVITQTTQTNVLCTNKIKLGTSITFFEGEIDGPGPITMGTNAFVTTTNGNDLTLNLNPSTPNGCLIYIAHSPDSTGTLTVTGIGGPNNSPPFSISFTVFPGVFTCFWKVQGEWLSSTLFD